jgi:hypothetical protein
MPNFTAGTSFGANDTVTNTKLNALIADATINPECALSINSGTIGTLSCTRGTIGTFNSTTGTVATLNTTTGSVQTLSAGTLATNLTGGTYSGLINSSTGTYSGLINSSTGTFSGSLGTSCNFTAGTIQTLTASTLTGTLTGGTYSGSIGTARSFTAGTINNFTSSSNASIAGLTVGTGAGQANVAFGSTTLGSNNTGTLNTGVGNLALRANTSGSFNVAFGDQALLNNVAGSTNSAFGVGALDSNTSGNNNNAFGYNALGANTTGSLNTAIGNFAGDANTTGTNNTFIGNGAANISGGATASNTIVLGNSFSTAIRSNSTTIIGLSDARDKSNIQEIPVGLDYINELKPVMFDWARRDGSNAGHKDFGFIAQDLQLVENKFGYKEYTKLVHDSNPDRFEADPMKTYPILIKAIQQLSAKVDNLEAQLVSK